MHWIYLMIAILLEVAGTTSMKLSQGFTKLVPSVCVFVLYAMSFSLLALALKAIDVSVAYAIWSGLGTALIAGIGIVAVDEFEGRKLSAKDHPIVRLIEENT